MAVELVIAIHLLPGGVKSPKTRVGFIFLNRFSLQTCTGNFIIKKVSLTSLAADGTGSCGELRKQGEGGDCIF